MKTRLLFVPLLLRSQCLAFGSTASLGTQRPYSATTSRLLGRKRRGRKQQKGPPKAGAWQYSSDTGEEEEDLQQLNRRDRMAKILERDGEDCVWCRTPLRLERATTDHLIPRIKGGPSWIENETAACRRCNKARGHQMPAEWMRYCRQEKGWEPNEAAVRSCLGALDRAIGERGGQRKARPRLAKQLKILGAFNTKQP